MNYIDLGIYGLLLIALIAGFCGLAKKKIARLFVAIFAAVTAYFTFNYFVEFIGSIKIGEELLNVIIINKLSGFFESSELLVGLKDQLIPMALALLKFLGFCLEFYLLLIVGKIISSIFIAIFIKKRKKPAKAYKTFGLCGLIRGAIIWVVILLPIFLFSPIIKNVKNLSSFIPQLADKPVVEQISNQFNESKVIKLSEKFFMLEGNKLVEYQAGDETKNLYSDLNNICNLTKAAPLASAIQNGENLVPVLQNLSEEDLEAVLIALDENKDLINSIVPAETFEEFGLNIEDISFKDEVPVVELALSVITFDENGEMGFDLGQAEPDKIVDALVESKLLETFVEPGMLNELPEENKTELVNEFNSRLEAGNIDQAKYDVLMSYINPAE